MVKRLIAFILIFALTDASVFAQYYLGVVQGESKKIPIAVLDVYDEVGSSALRALALDVLQADLRRSQIFDVMDPKSWMWSTRAQQSRQRI